ncbi:MAG: response regulator transcription factor [Bacteroidales bacterium]|nr:response regulator transcription factor [Bacteroidales bacterium]
MLQTLIIDDEKNNRNKIRELLEHHFPNVQVVGEADGVKTGLESIINLTPELVLLDIRLLDGDAFDLLNQLGQINFKIIFITAYEEYALKAIKFSALDYLLKPVLLDDLKAAIAKAETQILKELNLQLVELSHNLKVSQNKRIVLKTVDKLHFIPINEIMRCEADKNYTTFFLADSKKIVVSGTIKDYEDILSEQGFYRLHKSHIVNLSYIKSYEKADGGTVILSDGSHVPVALRKKNQLIELFNKL